MFDFGLQSRPVEAVTDLLGGVGRYKVAGKRVRVSISPADIGQGRG